MHTLTSGSDRIGDGVFYRNSGVRLADIIDGTSSTILVGERTHGPGRTTWVGAVTDPKWPGGTEVPKEPYILTCWHILGCVGDEPLPDEVAASLPPGFVDPFSPSHFSSRHPRGFNFVFADGHVEFLSAAIEHGAYKALATRAGNETVAETR